MRVLILLFVSAAVSLAQQVGAGNITTVVGTGTRGFSGDGGRGETAQVDFPLGNPSDPDDFGHLAVDSAGNLYIADKGNHRIRRLDTSGIISTYAGTGTPGFSGDNGRAASAALNFPCGLAVDRTGNVYVTDQGNHRVRRIDAAGVITTIAGSGTRGFSGDNGPALSAALNAPAAVAVDPAGNVYVADFLNDRVRRIDPSGVITTIAGIGEHGDNDPGRDGVPGTSIRLGYPAGLVLDAAGTTLFIADHHNNVVRALELSTGLIRRVAGSAVNGAGRPQGDGGPALNAVFDFPVGVALDAAGNLFVSDFASNALRRVEAPLTPASLISSPAGGRGDHGFAGDNGPARNAILDYPAGLAIDTNGNLYLADWHNQRVRKITPGVAVGTRPLITGIVNGASFAPPPARTAPGALISIFGERLASGTAQATVVPLPRALLDPPVAVTVTHGSTTTFMPLVYVSPGQINAQLPIEVPHSTQVTVIVRVGGAQSEAFPINISLAEAGVFTYPGTNRAIAQNQDGSLNSAQQGAPRGSTVVVYLTGEGALSPPVPTGTAAPDSPLSSSVYEVRATIGGANARVDFLGATPRFVGLSQANIVIPDNAPLGDQPLIINVVGHDSNRTVITIR